MSESELLEERGADKNKQQQNDEDNPASEGRPKQFPQGLGYLPEERRKRERGREREWIDKKAAEPCFASCSIIQERQNLWLEQSQQKALFDGAISLPGATRTLSAPLLCIRTQVVRKGKP